VRPLVRSSSLLEVLQRPGSRTDCFELLLRDCSDHLRHSRTGEFLARVGHRGSCDETNRDLDGGFHALTGAMILVSSICLVFGMGNT